MKIFSYFKDKWWIFALVFIFLFSYYIRAINIVPDRLLSFDPIFQYRFTKYFADWGHLPLWDELTYYVGRVTTINLVPPFMFYVTAVIYWLVKGFGYSLMTVASYASAWYGALIAISAFLLGRELSNKYGGLMAAVLMVTAPQILVRTFGSSYDTDQLVTFFMILTIYLSIYAMRKKTISSISLALIGFTGFMLTWWMFSFSFIIVIGIVIVNFLLSIIFLKENKEVTYFERVKIAFRSIKSKIIILLTIILGLIIISLPLTDFNIHLTPLESISALIGFAQKAEAWIVNVSIAELQPFSIFNLEGWILAMGRFVTGETIIDLSILISFILLIFFGLWRHFKKDLFLFSCSVTLFLIAVVVTFRGIRFTEFSSILFITVVSVGFGELLEWSKKDHFLKAFSIGLAIIIAIIALGLGLQVGQQVGPDNDPNWNSAWEFLKTKTPEFSIVGTWWDPGHMIAGLAERRNYADGAHCGFDCFYTINDRIVDLGKIMVTSDENESLKLIRKYQGDSPKVYWIASDDLIGKFQWLQYFGIGCDARTDRSCPLYIQMTEQSRSTDSSGNIVIRNYGSVSLYVAGDIPIPIYIQDINAAIFDEIMIYNNTQVVPIKFTNEEKQIIIEGLKPLEKQLNIRFTNQSIPMTVWIPNGYSSIVIIPPNLRETVFTKMFFLEGEGLEHFREVFRNDKVKIYEVI